ncbi:MAG: N-6 DNA methylase [Thermoguttaceae bacterium]|jgi:hypothetical protein
MTRPKCDTSQGVWNEGPLGRLVADFGRKAERTRRGVRACYDALLAGDETADAGPGAKDGGPPGPSSKRPVEALAGAYGLAAEDLRPELLLAALQCWYRLVVQLLTGHILAAVGNRTSPAECLVAAAPGPEFQIALERLVGGDPATARGGSPPRDPWLAWHALVCPEPLQQAIRELAARVVRYDGDWWLACRNECRDLWKPLYQDLFPRGLRHGLGEYYTPDWLAEHVLDQVDYHGQPDARLMDPACGSGTFLVAAIRRLREMLRPGSDAGHCLQTILRNVVGLDLHPLAAITARANYLLAVADLLPKGNQGSVVNCRLSVATDHGQRTTDGKSPIPNPQSPIDIPVYACDSILDPSGPGVLGDGFDYVVGNPPWIAWDNLPQDYRAATRPLWQQYGLFSLSGREARHGGGKKDLAMLMIYASADRYLRPGGRLGMVVTQTVFQTRGAGDGFRRFRLGPDGPWLGVLRVDDLVALRPFGDASNWSSTLVLEKGRKTQYPVHYVKWSSEGQQQVYQASPITADRPGSPWLVVPTEAPLSFGRGTRERVPGGDETPLSPFGRGAGGDEAPLSFGRGAGGEGCRSALGGLARLVGRSDYAAHLGANSGGANAVFWLEVLGRAPGGLRVRNLAAKGKAAVETVETVIEPDLLYPLVRWGDVDRFRAAPSAYLLLAQDPATRTGLDPAWLQRQLPRTYAYLQRFEPLLIRRAAYRRYQAQKPFYSMYNVGPYTVAPIKVIWRRMDRRIRAAVIEPLDDPWLGPRPVVPQETCVLVACASADEAHYLCAVLNSSLVGNLVAGHSVAGGKGFGTPGILDVLPIRAFDAQNPLHAALAACSRQAHQDPTADPDIDREIDRLLADLWGTA